MDNQAVRAQSAIILGGKTLLQNTTTWKTGTLDAHALETLEDIAAFLGIYEQGQGTLLGQGTLELELEQGTLALGQELVQQLALELANQFGSQPYSK